MLGYRSGNGKGEDLNKCGKFVKVWYIYYIKVRYLKFLPQCGTSMVQYIHFVSFEELKWVVVDRRTNEKKIVLFVLNSNSRHLEVGY